MPKSMNGVRVVGEQTPLLFKEVAHFGQHSWPHIWQRALFTELKTFGAVPVRILKGVMMGTWAR